MVSATMIWFATLVVWPVAVVADQGDVLAHQVEQRLHPVERRLRAADHDRERRRLGADLAARDRRIQVVAAELVDPLRERPWWRSARSSSCRPRSCPCDRPSATPSRPNSTFSTSGVSGTIVMMMSAFVSATSRPTRRRPRRLLDAVGRAPGCVSCTNSSCPPVEQVARHGRAHDAEADEADCCHVLSPFRQVDVCAGARSHAQAELRSPAEARSERRLLCAACIRSRSSRRSRSRSSCSNRKA